jgi:hypothetical protein
MTMHRIANFKCVLRHLRLPTKVLCSNCHCYVSIRTHSSRDCPTPTADAPSRESSCQEARQLDRTYLSPNERTTCEPRKAVEKEQRSQRAKYSTRGDHPPGRCYANDNYVDITLLSHGYYHCHVTSGAGCPDPAYLVWRCWSLVGHCVLPNRLTD